MLYNNANIVYTLYITIIIVTSIALTEQMFTVKNIELFRILNVYR